MTKNGLMSFRAHYGATRPHPIEPRERRLSSWSMGSRPSFPPEVTMGSLCVKIYNKATQDQLRCEDIDLVDQQRWQAAIKNTRYRQTLRRYHQRFMRSRELQVDDLVLRRVLSREGMNKLSPYWEGPYRVTQVCRPGCVCLATEEGEPMPHPWNIEHLCKFYS
jgi:hypothetical protein